MREIEGDALDNTTDVETPERIRFRHHVAGPVRRGLAYLLDLLIRGAVLITTALLTVGAGAMDSGKTKASWGLWLLVLFMLEWGWNVLFETFWRGRTIGKRVFGLRVVREGGYPVGFIDSVLRNLLRAADFLPVGYVLGLAVMAGDRRCRRLGDRIAGTMVVIETDAAISMPTVLSPPATPDELGAFPHRPPLVADELEAIELFLRRSRLSLARRQELAQIVVPGLARRMGVREGDPVRFLGLLHQRCLGSRRQAGTPTSSASPASSTSPTGPGRMNETQDEFVARRRADWDELGRLVLGDRPWHKLPSDTISRAAGLYRSVAADLMRARSAGYTPDLIAVLDGMAARGHAALYSAPPYRLGAITDLVTRDFPRTVRQYKRFVAFAAFLFVLPGIVGFTGARGSRSFALRILPEEAARQMEESYAHAPSEGRSGGDNAFMAGFYVHNNVGIAFRCFATGILFGLGSVFFLIYNGLLIGTVGGLVTAAGHGGNLLTFISGHGAFELTAIVISGAAGMVTGYALVATDGMTRFGSLRRRARDIAQLVLGAALMLVIAAGLEGFWSPSSIPGVVKLVVAPALWIAVFLYLTLAGRKRESTP